MSQPSILMNMFSMVLYMAAYPMVQFHAWLLGRIRATVGWQAPLTGPKAAKEISKRRSATGSDLPCRRAPFHNPYVTSVEMSIQDVSEEACPPLIYWLATSNFMTPLGGPKLAMWYMEWRLAGRQETEASKAASLLR